MSVLWMLYDLRNELKDIEYELGHETKKSERQIHNIPMNLVKTVRMNVWYKLTNKWIYYHFSNVLE